jgi:phosphate uptake regulator
MANSVISTLRDTIKAFNLSDEAVARHVLRGDDVVDALYHQIVQDTLTQMEGEQSADADVEPGEHHDRQEPRAHRRPLHEHRGRRDLRGASVASSRHLHAVL